MTGGATDRIAALTAAILAAAALAACGGSGSTATDSTAPAETTEASSQPKTQGPGNKAGSTGDQESGSQSAGGKQASKKSVIVDPEPLKVSGGGSAQYRVQGGDNSVQEFGEEGDESELEEAAAVLHGYLVARAEEDWAGACATLSSQVKDQLQVLASRSDELKGKGCAEILQALTPTLPPSIRRQSTIVDAGSLRIEGDRAFLIFRGMEASTYAILMTQDDGAWKVNSLASTPL